MFDKNVFCLMKVSLDFNTLRGTKSGILTLQGTTITPVTFIWESSPPGWGTKQLLTENELCIKTHLVASVVDPGF